MSSDLPPDEGRPSADVPDATTSSRAKGVKVLAVLAGLVLAIVIVSSLGPNSTWGSGGVVGAVRIATFGERVLPHLR